MSIYNALRTGVSALNANATAMAVISDNIANVNTIGYKKGSSEFVDLLDGHANANASAPGGVVTTTRRLVDGQGALQSTSSVTDLAISGSGMFVVSKNAQASSSAPDVSFTRAGGFSVDRDGNLVTSQGYYLQGWPVQSDGKILSSPTNLSLLKTINVNEVSSSADPTTKVKVNANLNSDEAAYGGTPAYTLGALTSGAITPDFQSNIEIYDSLGTSRSLTMSFLKTGPNVWTAEISSPDAAAANKVVASGQITFGADGRVATISSSLTAPGPLTWATSTGAAPQDIAFDLKNTLSQFAAGYSVSNVTTDGVPPGDLAELRVEDNGVLSAVFTNGRSRALYQIPVARFPNPSALTPDRGNVYRASLESGSFTLNPSNTGGVGQVKSSSLESSTVDLASEFTDMIVTQRAYSASSKIITTADQMLEELIQIKR